MTGESALPDEFDRRILAVIQSNFPLAARPYKILGAHIGLSEEETLARVERLRADGYIRRIGANFDARKMGCASTLAAASVPPEQLDAFVAHVNSYGEVTHNYLRNHRYNVWFTVIGADAKAVANIVEDISRATGVQVTSLPATRVYKIRVDFPMEHAPAEKGEP